MRHIAESNNCPQCGSHLGTNPRDLVRTDRTLQSIVDKVFPQFAQGSGPAKSVEKRASSPARGEGRTAKSARPPPAGEETQGVPQDEVSFSLQEEEPGLSPEHGTKLEKPFLRTKAQLTVAHLKKYLSKKMQLSVEAEVDILCRARLMPPEMTLDRIVREEWKDADDLVLNYRVRVPSVDAEGGGTDGDESAAN